MQKVIQKLMALAVLAVMAFGALGLVQSGPLLAAPETSFTTVSATESSNPPPVLFAQANGISPVDSDNISTSAPQAESCERSVGVLGWIICPIIDLTYGAFDYFVKNVVQDGLLRIDLREDSEVLEQAWAGFRTVANIVFVLAFLAIIYAELSGRVGLLDTFSTPRMLPKLVIAVIGVQLSFFGTTWLVELFNDLGDGVAQLILAPVEGFSQFELSLGGDDRWVSLNPRDIGEAAADSFIGLGLLAGAVWVTWIILESVLLFGLIGLIILFVTLVLRKVLIISFVVVSPIAIALWVLPGTSRVFSLWWDAFSKGLAMYPLIMMFLASGQLVGRLTIAGENPSFIDMVISIVASFAPLFLIPITFRLAGAAVAGVASFLTNVGEKTKGDVRDPNSMRGRVKQRRTQRYGRMMTGNVRTPERFGGKFMPPGLRGRRIPLVGGRSIMPATIARAYNRIPSTDATAGLMADILSGREGAEQLAKTLGDDALKAMAVTGGGKLRGVKVRGADGKSYNSGFAKLGNHFVYNDDGSIKTNDSGVALFKDLYGNERAATAGDFYDADTMSAVSKYAGNRGTFAASLEHTMTKVDNNNYEDQQQVWAGIAGSKWTADEKTTMSQGVWNRVKDQSLYQKFGKWGDYYESGVQDRFKDSRVFKTMDVDFNKMVKFFDSEIAAYPLQQQKAQTWSELNKGLAEFDTGSTSVNGNVLSYKDADAANNDEMQNRFEDLAYKARQLINEEREQLSRSGAPQIGEDEDGRPMFASGSSATGSVAREAQNYLNRFELVFGRTAPGGTVTNIDRFEPESSPYKRRNRTDTP